MFSKGKSEVLIVKVAITCQGSSLDHELDLRFGRAVYFLIVDTDTHFVEVIDNEANAPAGGAGIGSAQRLVDRGVEAVITGQVGPNALSVLKAAKMPIYQGIRGSAQKNLDAYLDGQLKALQKFVPSHSGK
jgi:predicted Fe-Mo cluster-binding NifX family protein